MSTIYIHIPFCRQACNYCNFHFSTTLHRLSEMVDAICHELVLRKDYLSENRITSIYFGGGTPSLLPELELQKIWNTIFQNYTIDSMAEITLEANPEDISDEKLSFWKTLGVNRFSMGVQSFFEEDLQWMNRNHTAAQSKSVIEKIKTAGFDNYTIDLIYGGPTLSDAHWKQNVETAIDLAVPHLSCYALTVEPNTVLDKLIVKHAKEDVDPEKQARHFEYLMDRMRQAGYDHYEVSNFGKPTFHSKHNSAYWAGISYLGVGPSAHSFNGKSRQWNVANNANYIQRLSRNEIPFEIEYLTAAQQLDELIMTSLRTMKGLDLNLVKTTFGENQKNRILSLAQKYIALNELIIASDFLKTTDKGMLFADGIAADLFC